MFLVGHKQSILLPGLPHRDEDRPVPVVLEHNRSYIWVFYPVFEEMIQKFPNIPGCLEEMAVCTEESCQRETAIGGHSGNTPAAEERIEGLSYISYVMKETGGLEPEFRASLRAPVPVQRKLFIGI